MNNLYEITGSITEADGSFSVAMRIDAAHPVLAGHFPSKPVVPGVYMVDMIKHAAEMCAGRKLRLTEGKNIKFISVLDPLINSQVTVNVFLNEEGSTVSINGSLSNGTSVFVKLKGNYE